ncbi:unnamed protein product [Sphenostylis stenocarpa]|uniref:Secreted protein n=1 Tax=Sphenostylis stenocarpa TaxID=92480 RepID=A0AA86SA81_9FABA|nr:unnamed protein product [Sphenostylis stenocarpa]
MELKVLVKVGLLLFLIARVHCNFLSNSFITQLLPTEGAFESYVKSTTSPCCDECINRIRFQVTQHAELVTASGITLLSVTVLT